MLKPILLPNHSQDGLAPGQAGSEREEVCTGRHTVHGAQPGCPCAQGQAAFRQSHSTGQQSTPVALVLDWDFFQSIVKIPRQKAANN